MIAHVYYGELVSWQSLVAIGILVAAFLLDWVTSR